MKCPICGNDIKREETIIRLSGRNHGKNFADYMCFIQAIKDGLSFLVVGPSYVVMDKATYDKLQGEHVP